MMANTVSIQFQTQKVGLHITTTNNQLPCTTCGGSLIFSPAVAAAYRQYRKSTIEPAYSKCVGCGAINSLTQETAKALAKHVLAEASTLFSYEQKCAATALLEGGKK